MDSSGHSARYLLSLAAPLRDRGDVVHILGNYRLRNTTDLADCEPTFTVRCEEAPLVPDVDPTSPTGSARLQRRRTELLCNDLDCVVQKHQIGPSDFVLVNSLRHWSLDGIVEWMERLGVGQAPTVVLVLHYTPYPQPNISDPTAQVYQDAFRRVASSPLRSRILLCTDSERLRDEYRSLHDVPIGIVPIPHSPEPVRRRRADTDSLSIVFAGEARRDKGFNLLPSAIREILIRSPKAKVHFDIQAYRSGDSEQEVPGLDLPVDEAVRVHPKPLSEAEYESFITGADLILIPYLRGPYQAQTSGVYSEATALGIPVVVPSRTWMADQVADHGGGLLFEAGDALSLADACLRAIEDYPTLRETARRAASSWRAFHSAHNFIACLEALLQNLPNPHEVSTGQPGLHARS